LRWQALARSSALVRFAPSSVLDAAAQRRPTLIRAFWKQFELPFDVMCLRKAQ
jgi:hypothetical protein